MKVKICGIRRPEDVGYINRYLPDYCGFVFAKSKRQVTCEFAKELALMTDERIIRVGVFVNEKPEVCADIFNKGIIDIIQLHGSEDKEYEKKLLNLLSREGRIQALHDLPNGNGIKSDPDFPYEEKIKASNVNIPILRAIRVREKSDLDKVSKTLADTVLLDAYSDVCAGGNGVSFDWSMLSGEADHKPFFLAGGINIDNVERAIKEVRPYGLDISSGVETDGFKSEEKICRIIERIRSYE